MLFLSLHVFLTKTPIIFSFHHHSSCHNIHIDCNCYGEVTTFIVFNVICVILSITIIIFDGGLNESNCLNSLLDNVSPEFENECDIISHSKYRTDVDFQ